MTEAGIADLMEIEYQNVNIISVKDGLECRLRYKADCSTMFMIDCRCFI